MTDALPGGHIWRPSMKRFGALAAASVLAAVLGTSCAREPRVEAATPAPQAQQGGRFTPTQESYADLVARVAPAVVTIRSVKVVRDTGLDLDQGLLPRFFGDVPDGRAVPFRLGGLGSGVVVSRDGYILTNDHVVEGADRIRVDFTDGRSVEAHVVGTDQPSDLALLKVAATGLAPLPLGDSDRVRVGDVVLAIGNPLGVGQTVTMGIVSAKGRATGASEGAFEDFIQTDAPINQGNSGGALINTRGELVGINSQILSPVGYNIGIGFAIPASMAQGVVNQLMATGHVRRGLLGVTVQAVDAGLASSLGLGQVRGAIVTDVKGGSPAAQAGITPGDVILALNGKPVASSNDLRNHVAPLGPGARVGLLVLRDGRERTVTATLAELPREQAAANPATQAADHGRYGLAVEPLTPELSRRLGIESAHGVLVTDVSDIGPAAEAGLQGGDVIEQVNGRDVSSVGELRAALGQAPGRRPALLLVSRQGTRLFLAMGDARG